MASICSLFFYFLENAYTVMKKSEKLKMSYAAHTEEVKSLNTRQSTKKTKTKPKKIQKKPQKN